jgi:hypothetical protein
MLAIADKLQTVCAVVAAADVRVIVETGFMVTEVLVENAAQPPAALIVYVTVYVPAVLAEGVIAPVLVLIDNPVAGLTE